MADFGFTMPDGSSSGSTSGVGSNSYGFTLPNSSSLAPLMSAAANGISSSPSSTAATQAAKGTPITQTERLFTARSRGAFINQTGGGDRGTRAYIKLLTSNPVSSSARTGSVDGFIGPANLTGPGGPLDQAINGGKYQGYAEFLLTNIRCSLDEKLQISETFGDGEVVYYFGRQPIMFTLAGYLIDSVDNSWFVDWINMYGHVMRGSQLAQNYELLQINLPNMTIVGSIPHMSWEQSSENDVQINFEFQFLAKQIIPTPVMTLGTPLTSLANQIDFNTADKFLSQQGINSVKSQAGAALSVVQNPSSTVGQIGASLASFGTGMSYGTYAYATSSPVSNAIDSVTGAINQATATVVSTVNDAFYSVEANLAGIRASLFSPIYGVLTSLTKLIANVEGDVAAVFNTLASPVANIIRDVTNVASQALGILGIINAATDSVLGLSEMGDVDMRIALGGLVNTTGCITTMPTTISMTLRWMLNSGLIPASAGFLQNPPLASLSYSSGNLPSKVALLNSGPTPTPQSGASL